MKQWIDGGVPVSDQLHTPTLRNQHAAPLPPKPITLYVPCDTAAAAVDLPIDEFALTF